MQPKKPWTTVTSSVGVSGAHPLATCPTDPAKLGYFTGAGTPRGSTFLGASKELGEGAGAGDRAKVLLGEHGPFWWEDGAPDYNRHIVKGTPCRD